MTPLPLVADGKPAGTIVLPKEPTRAAQLGLARTRARQRTVHHSAAPNWGGLLSRLR